MHKEAVMRTTLDLPKDLIDEAMEITKTKTKTALIIQALQDLIQKHKLTKLKKFKGKIDLSVDLTWQQCPGTWRSVPGSG